MGNTTEQTQALADFLARHAKPYDVVADDYERPPFSADVVSPGRSDFYNFHYYLTKVPPEAIEGLLQHFTEPGDTVLDPFCGSGMTGVAIQSLNRSAAREQRYCILNDLSPAACHIAVNYTNPIPPELLRKEFDIVLSQLKSDIVTLYATAHFEPMVGLYDIGAPAVLDQLKPAVDATRRPATLLQSDNERNWEVVTAQEVHDYLGYSPKSAPPGEQWVKIPATILYVVWSDVYKCEGFKTIEVPTGKVNPKTGKAIVKKSRVLRGCGKEIIARGTNDKQGDDGNNAFLRCPHCDERWMKGRIQRLKVVPVEEHYEYLGIAPTKNAPTFKLMRTTRPVAEAQVKFILSLQAQSVPVPAPNPPLDKKGPRYRRDSLAGKKIETYKDFFTHRNYWALAVLWDAISKAEPKARAALRFCVTSQVMRCSRLRRMKGNKPGEQLSGTLHICSETMETNVFRLFKQAVKDYSESVSTALSSDHVHPFVRVGSATDLREIPDGSIDYIFTDPPFGSNIYYSGVNFMWEAWLGEFTDEPLEAVMHRTVDGGYKRLDDYAALMSKSFKEMFRVLKPGRFATIEFNNSDGQVFQVIKDGITNAGFDIQNMLLFDKVERTYAQIRSNIGISEVVDKDVLFNVRKPSSRTESASALGHDLEGQVADAVRQHLSTLPERIKADPAKYSDEHRTTATINSMLMNTLIPRGVSVERLNMPFIDRVCARFFRKIGQRWYLRGEAVGGNGGNGFITEEIIIKDEVSTIDWLRQKLQVRPMLIGELKPLWMRATGLLPAVVSQSLVLEEILSENFWRDADSNRWREPTAEERERMNDDRSLRVLHDAERFLAGNLSRKTTDEERCEWVEVLFQACRDIEEKQEEALPALRGFDANNAYRVITQLFQSVLKDRVPADTYSRALKQNRAASARIANQVKEQKEKAKPKRKDDKQALIDFGGTA